MMKLLNLQRKRIHWCFQLLGKGKGNYISSIFHQCPPEPPLRTGTINIVKSDGMVEIYHRPVQVSELMTEFPKHMVCCSDSLYIGQKIPALSEDEQLQLGQNYFLLPKHFFQSVLSLVTVASFIRNVFQKKSAACQPLEIQKTPSGCLKILISDDFVTQLMEQGRIKSDECSAYGSKVCNTPQLQKDYTQLVVGSRCHCKPKLETIKEAEKRKISPFGMNKRSNKREKSKDGSPLNLN